MIQQPKTTTWPADWMNKIKCPQCKKYTVGVRTTHYIWKMTYLLPCQHQITQEQEDQIITDMLKKGI